MGYLNTIIKDIRIYPLIFRGGNLLNFFSLYFSVSFLEMDFLP